MQKLGIFINKKMTILIVGFVGTFSAINTAQSLSLGCPDCHRCTSGTEDNCYGSCVYDSDYCSEMNADCADGEIWDIQSQQCVPNVAIEIPECIEGTYFDSVSVQCVLCPSAPASSCNVTSSGDASAGISACYLVANTCSLSDASGSYTYTSDCHYN